MIAKNIFKATQIEWTQPYTDDSVYESCDRYVRNSAGDWEFHGWSGEIFPVTHREVFEAVRNCGYTPERGGWYV